VGSNALSLQAQPRPTDFLSKGFTFNAIDGRYPSTPALPDLVRRGIPLSRSREDGMLQVRFAADLPSAARTQYAARVQVEPACALLGYTVEMSDAPGVESFQDHLRIRQVYSVVEWQEEAGFRIPRHAEVETFGSVTHGLQPGPPSRTIYRRSSFRTISPCDVDPGLFAVQLTAGTQVHDERYHMAFEIGSRFLVLDGATYELDVPILDHPGSRLAEILQRTPMPSRRAGRSASRQRCFSRIRGPEKPRSWSIPTTSLRRASRSRCARRPGCRFSSTPSSATSPCSPDDPPRSR
jgi:hypothetical protein